MSGSGVSGRRADGEARLDDISKVDPAACGTVQRQHWARSAISISTERKEAGGGERGGVAVAGGVGPRPGGKVEAALAIPRGGRAGEGDGIRRRWR
eukprot:1129143-Prymnesium_polylepis.1